MRSTAERVWIVIVQIGSEIVSEIRISSMKFYSVLNKSVGGLSLTMPQTIGYNANRANDLFEQIYSWEE